VGPRCETERTVYKTVSSSVKAGDELGFDTVWAVSATFLEEYYAVLRAPSVRDRLRGIANQAHPGRPRHQWSACRINLRSKECAERDRPLDTYLSGGAVLSPGRSDHLDRRVGGFGAHRQTKKSWEEFVRCLPKIIVYCRKRATFCSLIYHTCQGGLSYLLVEFPCGSAPMLTPNCHSSYQSSAFLMLLILVGHFHLPYPGGTRIDAVRRARAAPYSRC